MNWFLRFYKWMMNTKFIMGMYFISMLFVYSAVVLIAGEKSVNIFLMLEMIIVSMLIAIIEKLFFPSEHDFKGKTMALRTVLWFSACLGIAVIAAVTLNWFAGLPAWGLAVYTAFMALVLILMWIGFNIAYKVDSHELNKKLDDYKAKQKN